MPFFKSNLSIKNRLVCIALLTTGFALLLTSIAVVSYEANTFSSALAHRLTVQAEMIGNNSTAALAFKDQSTAAEILSALRADPNIMSAALFSEDGGPFAGYLRKDLQQSPSPPIPLADGTYFQNGRVDIFREIILDQKKIGTISLSSDLDEFNVLLRRQAVAVFAIITASFILSFVLLSKLQAAITRPITLLVEAVRKISQNKDYSIRAVVQHHDEMGFLTESFNEMLSEIQRRDADLERHRLDLEKMVAERTAELLSAQEELVRKQKLAVLGQLAGSVGHELRNPLGVINNAIYYLKRTLSDADEDAKDNMNIIKGEVDNSLRIISDLLDFARLKKPQSKMLSVREVLNECVVKAAIPQNVALTIDIPDGLPEIPMDPLQMGQVCHNLVTNAVQAMPNGGVLKVSARLNDGAMRISISDTGEGISPESRGKLFQPLFTTKARGIGLGLTVVKNLTEAHGGAIEVESEPGKGTTFSVILPAAAGKGGLQ